MSDWPDVEGALRTWLRTRTALTALVGQRIFFGVPRGAGESSFPLVAIQRVGGGDDASDAPLDRALIQLDVWGQLDASGNGRKADAWAVVNALRTQLGAMGPDTTLASGVIGHGATVESVGWLPDPDSDRPRYAVTAEVTVIRS